MSTDFLQTLGEIRANLVEVTGREDLVNSDGSDNGANFYINDGIKFLAEQRPSTASRIQDIAIGTTRFTVENCQAIQAVSVTDANGWYYLVKLSLQNFRTKYPDLMEGASTSETPPIVSTALGTGSPGYYAIAQHALAPQDNFADSDDWANADNATYDYWDVIAGDHYLQKAILLAPIPDTAYTLRVWGLFYPKTLEDDGDMNEWTMRFPGLVVSAAAYKLEARQRNTAGRHDWLAEIRDSLLAIDRSDVHEEITQIDRIRG